MAKPIHMMVRVADEARSVDFYSKAFGLKVADRVDFPDFTLIYMRDPQERLRGRAHRQQGPRPSPTSSATATGTWPSSPTISNLSERA